MACPTVRYGVPSSGATEYNLNTGRELFRCGLDCVKMFLTNVSGEQTLVKYSCADISDALVNDQICMQSANISARDQGVVNWIAKENVDSSLPNGSVINKAENCAGQSETGSIYTHTEGSLNARVVTNIENIAPNREAIKDRILSKFSDATEFVQLNMEWILSDLGVNVSPTDWQGGSVTYQGFSTHGPGTQTIRGNFNWQNGRREYGVGTLTYDMSDETSIETIVSTVLGI